MNRQQLWRYGRDQVSAWLPALLMMLFALGTWWLVRSAPRPPEAPRANIPVQGHDYYMRDFALREFAPDGSLRSQLSGHLARHYPATDTLKIEHPQVRTYDRQGRLVLATALHGEASGDGSEVQLTGQARVQRQAGQDASGKPWPSLSFEGEHLHAFVNENRILSEKPVRLMRGQDTFTADRLEYHDDTGVALLQGRVRGVLLPGGR